VGAGVDPTTGLTYDQARWYDPATGQFMVVDPKVESTWMPYAYADDNPLSNTDPMGLCSLNPFSSRGCVADAAKAVKKAVTKAAKAVAKVVTKNPGAALEVTALVAVQFVPGVDVAVDATVGTVGATLGVYGAAQGLNYVTGHFSVGGAILDATFTFPAGFPELAEGDEAKDILKAFGSAVGATGVSVGVLANR